MASGPSWKAYPISLLTLLVPGLSHWVLGRRGRGLAFLGIVASTYAFGLLLHGALFPMGADNWLYRLGGRGPKGRGAPYFLGRALGLGALDVTSVADVMFGYGNTFLVTAGLMNMLLIMDAFDIAAGRKE
jgi:hypothetical protein